MSTTTTRPTCPYPCAGSGCPFCHWDAECIACESRPILDAHLTEARAWDAANPLTVISRWGCR